ncbi:CBS domain-containing protein [Nonomuraea zeae]|uniref:CBS domain-containing protein n=1 Tax=Nonomuraea zeae TaxID=1642303 RepID=A0A5S4GTE6_9ACTN|nr:CBS domain-containing protein [Nonomuraea zeae]TMR35801.1 CBS domain-containing protein [Nonomuraea zeae]
MRVTVNEIMTPDVACVTAGTPFKEIAETLVARGIGAVPVVDDHGRVIGVVSEADLLPTEEFKDQYTGEAYQPPIRARLRRHLSPGGGGAAEKLRARTAAELMTSPAVTVRPQQAVVNAIRLMDERGVVCVPVVDGEGRPAGILSRTDLVKVFVRPDEDLRGEIQDELDHLAWIDTSRVEVGVEQGVVTLRGRTRASSDASLVVRSVMGVNGVVDVHGELLWDEDDR